MAAATASSATAMAGGSGHAAAAAGKLSEASPQAGRSTKAVAAAGAKSEGSRSAIGESSGIGQPNGSLGRLAGATDDASGSPSGERKL